MIKKTASHLSTDKCLYQSTIQQLSAVQVYHKRYTLGYDFSCAAPKD